VVVEAARQPGECQSCLSTEKLRVFAQRHLGEQGRELRVDEGGNDRCGSVIDSQVSVVSIAPMSERPPAG
jgi:hypothetical protein